MTIFTQNSYGLDNEFVSSWGSFGINKPGHFSHPQFLAVDSEGNIYITDFGNKRIQKFSSDGEFLNEWGNSGKLGGEFHYPSGIAVDEKFVFVVDRDLHRIQKFDHDGKFVSQWGTKGIKLGQLLFPNDIVVKDQFVYVVDTGNHRIQKFSTNGDFVLSFGSSGINDGQFLSATGIDFDKNGNIYVTDRGNSKIEKFDSNGNHLKSLKYYKSNYPFLPTGIAIDPNNEIFVINSGNDRILHLNQESLYLDKSDQIGPYPDVFSLPLDITIGINGELIVTDSAHHQIQSFETEFYVQPEITINEKVIKNEVNITDFIKPEIISPPNIVLEATGILTFADIGNPITSDDGGIKTILNNAPDGFPLGVTPVTWIAFDNAGNSAHSFHTITVNACGKSYSEYTQIYGTDQDDILNGTNNDDLIFALDGKVLVNGGNGDDCIFGGNGDDILYGDDGNDILKGFSGNDVIYGNDGKDVIDDGDGADHCYALEDDLVINCES